MLLKLVYLVSIHEKMYASIAGNGQYGIRMDPPATPACHARPLPDSAYLPSCLETLTRLVDRLSIRSSELEE